MSDEFKIRAEQKEKAPGVQIMGDVDPSVIDAVKQAYPEQFGDKEIERVPVPEAQEQDARKDVAQESPKILPSKEPVGPADDEGMKLAKEYQEYASEKGMDIGQEKRPEPIITEADLDKFFQSIMDDEPYVEEYSFFNGKMKAVYRTRTIKETDIIISRISEISPETSADLENAMTKHYLAYSLVEVYTPKGLVKFDCGDLDERVGRLEAEYAHKYMILLNGQFKFEEKIEAMRKRAVNENF